MNTNFSRRVLLALILSLVSLTVLADSSAPPITGMPPLGSISGGPFDSIDLANLDVHFSIPVFSRRGVGIPFAYNLSYDSLVWVPVTSSSGVTSWQPASGSDFGWQDDAQAVAGNVYYTSSSTVYSCGGYKETTTLSGYQFVDPAGGSHPFGGSVIIVVVTGGSGCGSSSVTPITNSPALDNSGYVLTTDSSTATVIRPSGVKFYEGPAIRGSDSETVTDPNGNVIQVANNSQGLTTITDTLNTQALQICCWLRRVDPTRYTYTAPNQQPANVVVSYVQYTVQTNFLVPNIHEYPATPMYLVDKVTLPDGSYYQLAYEKTNGSGSNVTGRIASVRLPTGGTITYSYAESSCYNLHNCMMADGSPSYMARTVGGGTWTYSRQLNPAGGGNPKFTLTTVFDPASPSNETDLDFSGPFETQRIAYQGPQSSGVILDATRTCYNGQPSPCNTSLVGNAPISEKQFRDYMNSGAWGNHLLRYDQYDPFYGMVMQEYAANYGNDSPIIRVVNYNYNDNSTRCQIRNICNRPDSVQVTNDQTQKALTKYSYDSNGNPLQISYWVTGTTYLNQNYTFNSNGTVATASDVNGTVTYYNTGGYSCNNAFPNAIQVQGDWGTTLKTQYTYNCNGGVVTQVTDPNGGITTMSYTDPDFWRLASTTDALGNTTAYNYYNVTNFSGGSGMGVGQTESGMIWNNGHSTSDSVITLDTLGRPFLSQRRQAPGSGSFDTVETDYDTLGNANQQSQPFTCSLGHGLSSCTAPVTTASHDALHRPLLVTSPGGATAAYAYNLNDVEITAGPTQYFSKELEYNVLGQLISTCEMSSSLSGVGACGQHTPQTGYLTTNQYDPLGNLTVVTQGAQTRSFSYDGLNRMLSAANPENGTTRYTYDSDATCGTSTGDEVKRVDAAGNTTCYVWDGVHRLTQATYPSGPNSGYTQGKYFNYDNPDTSDGVTSTYSLGRLVSTYACCLQSDGWGVFEVYAYDKRGDTTDFYEGAYYGGATFHTVDQIAPNGAVSARHGYIGATGTNRFSNDLVYSFDGEGRPVGLTDQTTGDAIWNPNYTHYNSAGEPDQLVFYPSGDSEQFTWDPHPGHMQSWQSNVGTQSQSGHLTWHLNGTLAQLQISDTGYPSNNQTCSYGYDDLARLSSVNCGASIWQQNFGYDRYGNIAKSVPQGSRGAAFAATYNTANNRISNLGFSYDADGNVLNDNAFNMFIYDAEGRQANVNAFATYFDASNRVVTIQNPDAYYEIIYAPDGYKMAIMNGTSVVKYFAPLAAGVQAVYTANSPARISYWRHADWQGSSRIASTIAQHVYYDGSYAPFGENYNETGNDRSYTDQTQDTSSGIYDFRYRQLSSNQGRWFVPDPSGLAAVDINNPQSLNRYAYVGNNPISNVDPLGLDDEDGGDDGFSDGFSDDFGDDDFYDSQDQTFTCSSPPCTFNDNGSLVYNGDNSQTALIPQDSMPTDITNLPDSQDVQDADDDSFLAQGNMLAYNTFGPPSAGTWASASFVANTFAGATLLAVGGVVAAPTVVGTGVNIAATGFGWYYGLLGPAGVVLGTYAAEESINDLSYVDAAESIGANYLDAPNSVYNYFNDAGAWETLENAFIDSSVFRGQQIYLNTDPAVTSGESYLLELEHLQQLGINPVNLPWTLVPK